MLNSLNALAATAKPEDLLVVFFAGHGDLLLPGPKGGTIPDNIKPDALPKGQRGIAAGGGLFVLCCPEYSEKNDAHSLNAVPSMGPTGPIPPSNMAELRSASMRER